MNAILLSNHLSHPMVGGVDNSQPGIEKRFGPAFFIRFRNHQQIERQERDLSRKLLRAHSEIADNNDEMCC
jgi:hypothetical protein